MSQPQYSPDQQPGVPGQPIQQPYGAPQQPFGGPEQPYGIPPHGYVMPPPQKPQSNGLSIAALILAFILPLIGFVLGVIAAVKSSKKGLAIAAIVISVVMGGVYTVGAVLVVAKAGNAIAASERTDVLTPTGSPSAGAPGPADSIDPACVPAANALIAANDKMTKNASRKTVTAALTSAINGMTKAKATSTDPKVTAALSALINEYGELRTDLNKLKTPSKSLENRIAASATAFDKACGN